MWLFITGSHRLNVTVIFYVEQKATASLSMNSTVFEFLTTV